MKIKYPDGKEIELTIEEYKELGISMDKKPSNSDVLSSIVSVDPKNSIKPLEGFKMKRKEQGLKVMGCPRKITLEDIKRIKDYANQGMGNKDISNIMKISTQSINYWRKNTPKNIND